MATTGTLMTDKNIYGLVNPPTDPSSNSPLAHQTINSGAVRWDKHVDLSNAVVRVTTNQTIAGDKTFTGTLVAPTPVESDNTTKLATTAWVNTAIDNLVDGAPASLNTLNELAAAINDDNNYHTTVTTALNLKAPLAGPTFTGIPAVPTASAGTNTTQVATTAFVKTAVDNLVDSAPGSLDTLNELAAALGDDANYAATVTTALAAKQASITTSARLNANLIHDGTVSNTEFGYVNGVTSAIQTQIDSKQATITDNSLTIARTNGLQAALDDAGISVKPTLTIPELSGNYICLNFTEGIKDVNTYDKDDFSVVNDGSNVTISTLSITDDKVLLNVGSSGGGDLASQVSYENFEDQAYTGDITTGTIVSGGYGSSSYALKAGSKSSYNRWRVNDVTYRSVSFWYYTDTANSGSQTAWLFDNARQDYGTVSGTNSVYYNTSNNKFYFWSSASKMTKVYINGVDQSSRISTSWNGGATTGTYDNNAWHHIYLEFVGADTMPVVFGQPDDDNNGYATSYGSWGAGGKFDDVRIFDTALTTSQISDLAAGNNGSGGGGGGATTITDIEDTVIKYVKNATSNKNIIGKNTEIAVDSFRFIGLDRIQRTVGTNDLNITDISGLTTSLSGKQATITDGDLTIARTTGLQAALDAKQASITTSARLNANLIHDGTISNTEFGYLNGVTSAIQTQIASKQATIGDGDLTIARTTGLQAALDAKAALAGPTFTGTPAAATAAAGTNTTQLATTAFVKTAVDNLVDSAPGALDTLNELAAAIGDDSNYAATVTTALAAKQASITTSARLNANLIHDGTVSNTEFGYVNGVTSAIQTQIDSKQATITDNSLTIARTNGLQAALDSAGVPVKPTLTIPELSSGNILLNFTEGIKNVGTYDKADFAITNDGSASTIDSISVVSEKVKLSFPVGAVGDTVSTFAGTYNSDGLVNATGTSAKFDEPRGMVAVGTDLYVCDRMNDVIRKITSGAVVTTFAGSGAETNASTDGTGTGAGFNEPNDICSDGTNLYVLDKNCIRKIVIATAVVTTLAGVSGTWGYVDATGTSAEFSAPYAIETDGTNLYIASFLNHCVRKVVIATGVVTTLVGNGSSGTADGTGSVARFNKPFGITIDSTNTNLYVLEREGKRIRKVVISTAVVTTLWTPTNANDFSSLEQIILDNNDEYLYFCNNGKHTIYRFKLSNSTMSLFAGQTDTSGSDNGALTSAKFYSPFGITFDSNNNLYIAEERGHTIRKIVGTPGPTNPITDVQNTTIKYTKSATANKNLLGKDTDVAVDSFNFTGINRIQNTISTDSLNITDISGLTTTLTGKQATIGDGDLTIARTTGLQAALDAKQASITTSARLNANLIHDGTVSNTEFGYLNGVTSALQTQIASKQATIGDGDLTIARTTGLQAALDAKAALAGPTFTGTPIAPTATAGTNTTQIATTAFVKTSVDNLVSSAPGALDTLNELAAAIGDDANYAATVTTALAAKQASITTSARLNANLIHDGTVSNTEFGYVNGVTSAIQTQIDSKQATITDNSLTIARTNGLQAALDAKQAAITSSVDVSLNNLWVQGDISCNGGIEFKGHILPLTHETYDIGSAERKIRHLFLSDNSLWIGDDHKIDISGGKMKFKKRKKDAVPASITAASGNQGAALAHAGVSNLVDMTLQHWHNYSLTLNVGGKGIGNALINDIYVSGTAGDWEDDDALDDDLTIARTTGLQAALDAKAALAGPTFTGTPAAATAAAGTNTTQLATTAFVKTAVDNLVDSAPGALDTLNELAAAIGDDANYAATVTTALATKQASITTSARLNANLIHDGSISNTEFGYLNGVTSAIQTQIDSKHSTISSSARLNAELIAGGTVDNTEFGYIHGVTSAIQTQIDTTVKTTGNQQIGGAKTFTSDITGDLAGNASTATALENMRTIAGQNFNGTQNVTIAAANLSDVTSVGSGAIITSTERTDYTDVSNNAVRTSGAQTVAGAKTFSSAVTVGNYTLPTGAGTQGQVLKYPASGSTLTWGSSGSGGSSIDHTTDVSLNDLGVYGDLSCNAVQLGGHVIPKVNAAYDLGNAEFKIRHLFLSSNSLWIGDDHKIDISGGKMKFKKRKKDSVPASITSAGGDSAGALTHSGAGNLSAMTLQHWHNYGLTLNVGSKGIGNAVINDIYVSETAGDWDEDEELDNAVKITGDQTIAGVKTFSNAIISASYTSTERDALTGVAGMVIFNTTTNKHQGYNGSSWNDFY